MKQGLQLFLITFFLCTVCCISPGYGQKSLPNYNAIFKREALEGKWYLVMTNARHWNSDKTTNITFDFVSPKSPSGETADHFNETISYLESGKPKERTKALYPRANKEFGEQKLYRGKHSQVHWYIVATATDNHWLVIYLHGGLFRKDAIEVISRNPNLDKDDLEQIRKLFEESYFLQSKTKKIRENIQK
jgi:hypothetical protein